ncbi:hypothetical protein BDZ45DRAFT_738282 [Acephala macrosclerotiorum]|nr:hypothetical protein BDZ45DRAFT_738282 [Acephala macrosclerotiorum]
MSSTLNCVSSEEALLFDKILETDFDEYSVFERSPSPDSVPSTELPAKPGVDDEPPAKRQKREAAKISLRELPSDEFLSKLSLYAPPMVTVRVDDMDFPLPRGLLCYSSDFFNRALNGYYIEATQDQITLPRCSVETFGLVVQWLYHAKIVLPTNKTLDPKSRQITRLLVFLKLADRILLLGPFDDVVSNIKALVLEDRTSLQAEHIRMAAELPASHGVRKLFAQACVKDYLASQFPRTDKAAFKFNKEFEEVECFAADLFKEYNETFLQRKVEWGNSGSYEYVVHDPLDGGTLSYKTK